MFGHDESLDIGPPSRPSYGRHGSCTGSRSSCGRFGNERLAWQHRRVAISEHLEPSLDVLRRAFPDGVPPAEYEPLLRVLDADLSHRNLAELVAELTGYDPSRVDYDHARVMSPTQAPVLDPAIIHAVEAKVVAAGWMSDY